MKKIKKKRRPKDKIAKALGASRVKKVKNPPQNPFDWLYR